MDYAWFIIYADGSYIGVNSMNALGAEDKAAIPNLEIVAIVRSDAMAMVMEKLS
jgi:hypothetical protein